MPSLQTPLTRTLGLDVPVVQAPIGSATCPELAAAVSDAGGLGTLAMTWRDPDSISDVVAATRRKTDGPIGANVVADPKATSTPTEDPVDAVDVPVVAAGGIADGRGLAAALALGADAGWVGTRFVATEEAHVHEKYRRRLVEAAETDTVSGTPFDEAWPDVPHRVLRNATVDEWVAADRPPRGERPGEDDEIARVGGRPVSRYEDSLATPDATGDVAALPLDAGQSSGFVSEVRPAATVVERFASEARVALDGLCG